MIPSHVVSGIQSIAYVVASVLFIVGLKGLSHPRKAVRGNLLGAVGMLVAVIAVLLGLMLTYASICAVLTVVGAALLGHLRRLLRVE